MGFGFHALKDHAVGAFVFLYCTNLRLELKRAGADPNPSGLTNFFQNFGPNTTTFIVPGEVFPTRCTLQRLGVLGTPC